MRQLANWVLLMFLMFLARSGYCAHDTHWSYNGSYGPAKWSLIHANCGLKSQSPVDISIDSLRLDDQLDEIRLVVSNENEIENANTSVRNNGHTVNLQPSTTMRLYGGKLSSAYRVAGIHFHWGLNNTQGSEHTISGKHFPLEMHIVSYDEENYGSVREAMVQPKGLAVIGLLFQISDTDNVQLSPLINILPDITTAGTQATLKRFDVRKLLPPHLTNYYRYSGSLTTPECYESVIWTVLKEHGTVSKSQLQSFRNLLEEAKDDNSTHKIGFNWRPTQPLNGRVIYSSFSQPSLEAPPPTNRASKTAFDAVNWITLAMIAMSNF